MPKTPLTASQSLQNQFNNLVKRAKTAIIVQVKNLADGQYLLNKEHARCGDENWENDYFKGFEVVHGKSKFPDVNILLRNMDDEPIELNDWNSLDDLLWLLAEIEEENYKAELTLKEA